MALLQTSTYLFVCTYLMTRASTQKLELTELVGVMLLDVPQLFTIAILPLQAGFVEIVK